MTRASLAHLALAATTACAAPEDDPVFVTFDDRRVICAASLDDWTDPIDWELLQRRIDTAVANDWVLSVYAHRPGLAISIASLERALEMFAAAGLVPTTFAELEPGGAPFAGVALSFDDHEVDEWFAARTVLAAHPVTFFVTHMRELGDEQWAKLHALAADGHAVESHSLTHVHPIDYAAEHGVGAYVADEVVSSLDALRAQGFAPAAFAYPYGERTGELDAAIAPHARLIRATRGDCPY